MDAAQDPAALVLAFIADYDRWNAAANARLDKAGEPDAAINRATKAAERDDRALLAKYCRPGFTGEPVAFGTPSLHPAGSETVVSCAPRGGRCLVRTRTAEDEFGVVVDFEYRLSRADERWYLERVTVVDGTGPYESL